MQLSDSSIGLAAAGACVLLWLSVCALSAKFGVWSKLQNKYPTLGIPTGTMYRFRSASFGRVSYNNALNMQVSSRGLYMVPMMFFRFGHSPILIPWREMRITEKKGFLGTSTFITIGQPEIATMQLGSSFMEQAKIRQYIGNEQKNRSVTPF